MNRSLFDTFVSPYQVRSLKSRRYQKASKYVIALVVLVPLLYLVFQSVAVYFVSQAIICFLFPVFVWIYLNTDELTDLKLDIIKVCVILTFYCSYLLLLSWIMIRLFQPSFATEFVYLSLGYNLVLVLVTIVITAIFFHKRYGRTNNHKPNQKENTAH